MIIAMQRLNLCLICIALLVFVENSACFHFMGQAFDSTSSYAVLAVRKPSQFALSAWRSSNNRVGSRSAAPRPNQRLRPVGFVSTKLNDTRKAKTGRIIRDELLDIICNGEIKALIFPEDDMLRTVSIDDVRQIFLWLCENIGQVRFELNKRLRSFRRVPIITFAMTDTQSEAYLNQVLDEISVE